MRQLGVLLFVVVWAAAASAEKGADKAAARVAYVGGGAAFLDRGARDGVVVGGSVALSRSGKKLPPCVVEFVGDHSARCAFPDAKLMTARPGDRALFTRGTVVEEPKAQPQPLPKPQALAAARDAVLAARLAPVVFEGSRKRAGTHVAASAVAALRARSWFVVGGGDSAFVRPSLDVGARSGLPIIGGLFAGSSLRVQGDVIAPANERFRNGVPAEVYLWDAAVGIAPGAGPVTAMLGRFRPARVPGVSTLDGALVGFSGFGGALEIGAYGGLVPDLITTAPSTARVSMGAYFGLDAAPTRGFLVLPRARLGLVSSSDFTKTRAEAEGQVQALWTNLLSIGASVRAALPGSTSTPTLDGARVDVDVTPGTSLRARAGWRMLGSFVDDLDAGVVSDGTLVTPVRAAHHGDAGVWWTTTSWLVLGGVGGVAIDSATTTLRGFVGPEVSLPALFGDRGGVAVGVLEEPGTTWGRSAWLQTNVRPFGVDVPLSWSTRASYFEHEAPFLSSSPLDGALREGLVMTFVDAPISPGLLLRGRAQSLFDFADLDGFGVSPTGLFFDVGVTGAL